MGGNYEKGMYNQLTEVMARLDTIENELRTEKQEHKDDVDSLNRKIESLTCENRLLKDDNARLRSIINNGRTKSGRRAGGQKGHKGTALTKADILEKIRAGKCRHEIKTVGTPAAGKYVTKYVVGLKTETVVTEVRIYADEQGKFQHSAAIPQRRYLW